jgi:hypothetical protein
LILSIGSICTATASDIMCSYARAAGVFVDLPRPTAPDLAGAEIANPE